MAIVAVLAQASCGGIEGNELIETQTAPLVATAPRLLHDNPPGGCNTNFSAGEADWYPNYCKTECGGNVAATGMSSSFPAEGSCGINAPLVFFIPIPLDPGPGPGSAEEFPHRLACGDGSTPAVDPSNSYILHFEHNNDQHSPNAGDWASGLDKGECDNGYAITAVASDNLFHHYTCDFGLNHSSHVAYGVVGGRCNKLAVPAGKTTATAVNCSAVHFANTSANELGGGTSWSGDDWDPGYHKGECGPGRFLKGIAHPQFGNGSARTTDILCCGVQYN
jgi:hypothetical protein